MTEFKEFAKIPRLSRECTLTEKIDGTNACICIEEFSQFIEPDYAPSGYIWDQSRKLDGKLPLLGMRFGSRTRWITAGDDNFGFAKWGTEHAEELFALGPGTHYGEWWGRGVQRNYGIDHRRFSLFNTSRWYDSHYTPEEGYITTQVQAPACCHVVPVLYQGMFCTLEVERVLNALKIQGSLAAPGFMKPEGIVVYHHAAGHYFKKTCEHDDEPKNAHAKKERTRQEVVKPEPRIMWTGGRRHGATAGYAGVERRIPK